MKGFTIRVSESEWKAWKLRAVEESTSVTELVRRAMAGQGPLVDADKQAPAVPAELPRLAGGPDSFDDHDVRSEETADDPLPAINTIERAAEVAKAVEPRASRKFSGPIPKADTANRPKRVSADELPFSKARQAGRKP